MTMLIGQLGKDKSKVVQVNIEEYKGNTGVDIREWYLSDGKWYPTAKGIRIQLDIFSDLLTLLEKAEAEVIPQR